VKPQGLAGDHFGEFLSCLYIAVLPHIPGKEKPTNAVCFSPVQGNC